MNEGGSTLHRKTYLRAKTAVLMTPKVHLAHIGPWYFSVLDKWRRLRVITLCYFSRKFTHFLAIWISETFWAGDWLFKPQTECLVYLSSMNLSHCFLKMVVVWSAKHSTGKNSIILACLWKILPLTCYTLVALGRVLVPIKDS